MVTTYCCDGAQVIAEYDDSGTLLRKFIYGLGSTIVEKYSYNVFGQPNNWILATSD